MLYITLPQIYNGVLCYLSFWKTEIVGEGKFNVIQKAIYGMF